MQRSIAKTLMSKSQVRVKTVKKSASPPPFDVFINHRGTDTKRTVATLLYDHLLRLRIRPFLDSKTMKAGDKLFDKIDAGIRGCRVGIAVFSPRYCDSYFCLHELALMMDLKKKMIPIFCDVKPSQLRIVDDGTISPENMRRFTAALEEAKHTVGLDFDSHKGNWSDVVKNVADNVIESLAEIEDYDYNYNYNYNKHFIQNNNLSIYTPSNYGARKSFIN